MVLLTLTSLRFPFTDRIKEFFIDGFAPFPEFLSRAQDSAVFLFSRFKAYGELQNENLELRKQVAELSSRMTEVKELERRNREFRNMLDFKERSELKLVPAKVVSHDPSNWSNTVLVDRGSDDGIKKDMPVLTIQGLAGKTLEVTRNNARVILICDENCRVPAWLNESALHGIVQGNALAGGPASQCRMIFLERSAQIQDNDLVHTSGLGAASGLDAVFPKGILIGTLRLSSKARDSVKTTLYQEATVAPAVDLARIDEVFIGVGVKPSPPAKSARPVQKKD